LKIFSKKRFFNDDKLIADLKDVEMSAKPILSAAVKNQAAIKATNWQASQESQSSSNPI
jgi:hypothetical protein